MGSHVLKTYSRQQKTVALSSAEAELHAMVAASAEALGIVALLSDMGVEAIGEVYADSSAALGIAQRQGMGKVRHIRTQALWVQEVRVTGRLAYKKVLGSRNPRRHPDPARGIYLAGPAPRDRWRPDARRPRRERSDLGRDPDVLRERGVQGRAFQWAGRGTPHPGCGSGEAGAAQDEACRMARWKSKRRQ